MELTHTISKSGKKLDSATENAPKKLSKSERWFNWLTYGGIAGVVTFILSIPVGYWARYSRNGQQSIKSLAKYLNKAGISEHVAEDIVMTTALMQGGNVTLPFVKMMENHKTEIVKKLGEKDEIEAIKKEPKQTWGSLIKARVFLAWTPVFLSLRAATYLVGKEHFDTFEKKFAEYLLCKPLGKPTHILGEETKLFKIGRIAALDVFATAAAATLLFIGSRFFAKKPEQKKPALQNDEAMVKNNTETPANEAECAPCKFKSFANALNTPKSYAESIAGEKAKAAETHLALSS